MIEFHKACCFIKNVLKGALAKSNDRTHTSKKMNEHPYSAPPPGVRAWVPSFLI